MTEIIVGYLDICWLHSFRQNCLSCNVHVYKKKTISIYCIAAYHLNIKLFLLSLYFCKCNVIVIGYCIGISQQWIIGCYQHLKSTSVLLYLNDVQNVWVCACCNPYGTFTRLLLTDACLYMSASVHVCLHECSLIDMHILSRLLYHFQSFREW